MKLTFLRWVHIMLLYCFWSVWVIVPVQSQEATVEPTPGSLTLSVWLPDLLVPPDNAQANTLLTGQIAAFVANERDVVVDTRLKRVGDVGGIMATLRAASAVAPGALPDVTLLRRLDMVAAQREGLIQSLEGEISSALLSNLDTALKLGQVNNTLYGVPYAIDLLHGVYLPVAGAPDNSLWDYESVLNRGISIAFAAEKTTGLNDVVYLQYLAAGAGFSLEGALTFNQAALLDVLDYYARLRAANLIDSAMLNYTQPIDYMNALLTEDIQAGIFTSGMYLQMLESNPHLRTMPIPTIQGQMMSLMNGWMWVLVADEPEKQALALRFINYMMQSDNQTAYVRAINWLPSQRTALLSNLPRTEDVDLYRQLLDNSVLPLTDGDGGTLARAIQDGFEDVLAGEDPAVVVSAIAAQQGG